ncbi:class I SAM-dependent methyltransferase [Altererythrobacter sp. GH1-8]|uniref:class I SAM-dependent methyltransferase n=1 Tax=Altererythrobacter sp. GH1-8 TaxID=3349333 RepID=UPI00374D8F94
MRIEPGSFRDPAGRVFKQEGRVFRAVFEPGREAFEKAREAGVYNWAVDKGFLVAMEDVAPETLDWDGEKPAYLLEHPALDFISYPYEWTFSQLKRAALFHLDFHLKLLERDFTLTDATAYNVQFVHTRPVFIDHLSIQPYKEGSLWAGQRQFAMQFFCPLLLWAKCGIAPNAWYRGNLEGISPEELAPLLPFKARMSFTVMGHVTVPAKLQRKAIANDGVPAASSNRKLSKQAFTALLTGLRHYIAKLEAPGLSTVWGGYDVDNSYDEARRSEKHRFVSDFVSEVKPGTLFDLGCNSGDYSQAAIDAGAGQVVGFDFDFGALEQAYARFSQSKANVLSLWLDATNPSPAQGWASAERMSFGERSKADAMVALAFIHHLAIAKNVPLDMAVDWLMAMAPQGVIEFPGKGDAMVQRLLSTREDIFPNYTLEAFRACVERRGRIVKEHRIASSERYLVQYERAD